MIEREIICQCGTTEPHHKHNQWTEFRGAVKRPAGWYGGTPVEHYNLCSECQKCCDAAERRRRKEMDSHFGESRQCYPFSSTTISHHPDKD